MGTQDVVFDLNLKTSISMGTCVELVRFTVVFTLHG